MTGPMRLGSLCSGIGGLDEGVRWATGAVTVIRIAARGAGLAPDARRVTVGTQPVRVARCRDTPLARRNAKAVAQRPHMGRYEAAIQRWEHIHGPAPHPLDNNRLNPDFVEWLMGFPAGWTFGRRNARLKMLGNAVVPHAAAHAWAELAARA